MKNQNLATQILADNPGQNSVYITEDSQAFFNEIDAVNHSKRNDFKNKPEVFFREGFEPEDTKTLQEAHDAAVEKIATLEETLKLIVQAVNLEDAAPEVTSETEDVVAKVVGLRQLTEELKEANAELIASNETLEGEKTELQNQLDTLKATPFEVKEEKGKK